MRLGEADGRETCAYMLRRERALMVVRLTGQEERVMDRLADG